MMTRTMTMDSMRSRIFAVTSSGLPVIAYEFGRVGRHVLILGGVHGDEIEGVVAAHGLLQYFARSFPMNLRMTVVPTFNLDGVLNKERRNANEVDLNRNLCTRDWSPVIATPRYAPGPFAGSEPENQALMKFLEAKDVGNGGDGDGDGDDNHLRDEGVHLIISLHSWQPMLNINGDCAGVANAIACHTGYKVVESIGYPTPGSLGTYAGIERAIPTLTYEIERGLAQSEVLRIHVPAILEGLKYFEAHASSARARSK